MAQHSTSTSTSLQFPPVPLASGDTVTTGETTTPVVAMDVTVHLGDGGEHKVALEYRFGGWWVPADALTI